MERIDIGGNVTVILVFLKVQRAKRWAEMQRILDYLKEAIKNSYIEENISRRHKEFH